MTQPRKKRKGTGTSSTKLKKVGHDIQTRDGSAQAELSTTTNSAETASHAAAAAPPWVSEQSSEQVSTFASQPSSDSPSTKPSSDDSDSTLLSPLPDTIAESPSSSAEPAALSPTGSHDSPENDETVDATGTPKPKPAALRSSSPPPSHVVWARASIPAPASARSGSQPHLAPLFQRPSVPAPSQPPPAIRPGFRKMVPPSPPHRSNTPPPVATTKPGSFAQQPPASTESHEGAPQPSVAPTKLDTRDNPAPSAASAKSYAPPHNVGLKAPHSASKVPPGLPPPSSRIASNAASTGATSATPPSVRPASTLRPGGGAPSAATPSVRPASGNAARPFAAQRPVAPRPPSPRTSGTPTEHGAEPPAEQPSAPAHKPLIAPRNSPVHKPLTSRPSASAPKPPSSHHAETPAAQSSLPVEATGTPSARAVRASALPPRPSTVRPATGDSTNTLPQDSASASRPNAPSAPSRSHKPPATVEVQQSSTDIEHAPHHADDAEEWSKDHHSLASKDQQDEPVASTVGSALKMAAAAHGAPAAESVGVTEPTDALPAPPAELLAIVDASIGSAQDSDHDPLPETTAAVAIAQPVGNSSPGQQATLIAFAKHRVRLMIAAGVVAVVSILAFALRSGAPAPTSASTAPSGKSAPIEKAVSSPSGADQVVADKPVEPQAAAAPAPSATAAVDPAASEAAPADDEVAIQVVGKPEGAQFLYKGKVIGRTPFVLKQPRNEKRTYEVMKRGYTPRRMVVRGTEKMVGFELPLIGPYPDSL